MSKSWFGDRVPLTLRHWKEGIYVKSYYVSKRGFLQEDYFYFFIICKKTPLFFVL